MANYTVALSENGWEYTGYIHIEADSVEKVDNETLIINGARVVFDEEVVIV